MPRRMKIKLYCDGELINKHSQQSGMSTGWSNPIEVIPPIGSQIDYVTFDYSDDRPRFLKTYEVLSVRFKTEESWNNSYKDEVCVIKLKLLNVEEI